MNWILIGCTAISVAACSSLSGKDAGGGDIVVHVEGYPLTVATVYSPPGAGSYELTPQHVLAVSKPKPVIKLKPPPAVVAVPRPTPSPKLADAKVIAVEPTVPPLPDPHAIVHFEFDSAELQEVDRANLTTLARAYSGSVLVIGYTDSLGSNVYNDKLSLKRAAAVKEFLVRRGIRQENIHIRGAGESHPVAPNASESGRALNRRADLEFTRN